MILSPYVEKTRLFLAGGCEVVSTLMQTREVVHRVNWTRGTAQELVRLDAFASHSQFWGVALQGGVTGGAASCYACVHSGLGFSGHLPALPGR